MMFRISELILWILLLTARGNLSMPQNEEYTDYPDYGTDGEEITEDEVVNENVVNENVVNESAPQFEEDSRTISVKEGGYVKFNCKTLEATKHLLLFMNKSQGSDAETVIYVGGMKIYNTKFLQNEPGIFSLRNVRRMNAGTFICIFQTSPPVVLEYILDVQYAPTIKLVTAPEQRVAKGGNLFMACEAEGNPKPEIMWSKVDGKMPSGLAMQKALSITLQNVGRHVEGEYKCTAANIIGKSDSKDTRVLVEYPPEIVTEKAIIRSGEGDKVELVCIVHARPVAFVTWMKDGNDLQQEGEELQETEGGHRHTISIPNVTEKNFGSYKCSAENQKGKGSAIINLTDLPMMPQFTSDSISEMGTEYNLTWTTESYYPIREYSIKYRMAKANESSNEPGPWLQDEHIQLNDQDVASYGLSHEMSHILTDLEPDTDYQARIIVKNQFKWGAEAMLNFSTKKESTNAITTSGGSTISLSLSLILASFWRFLSSR